VGPKGCIKGEEEQEREERGAWATPKDAGVLARIRHPPFVSLRAYCISPQEVPRELTKAAAAALSRFGIPLDTRVTPWLGYRDPSTPPPARSLPSPPPLPPLKGVAVTMTLTTTFAFQTFT